MEKDISRRSFVKLASAGATAAAIPSMVRAKQAPSLNVLGANDRVRVACVG